MTRGIYCYIDKKNNEIVYVGRDSSIHRDSRHKAHFYPSSYDKQQINRVLQNNPDRYIYQRLWEIDDCTDNHLNEMEKYYTKIYDPKFSFTEGGDGTSGYKWTDEQKKKISGENNPMYGRTGENHPMYGRAGENHPMYGRTGEKSPVYGRKHTEEECQKMRENHTRYWQGKKRPEHSEKMKGKNHPNWGNPRPEETKRKISKTCSEKYNTTGFYRVYRQNNSSYKKGFRWCYRYYVNSQRKFISSTDLKKLQIKVENQGLEWRIINKANAEKSLEKDKEGVK